jgi:hypothetical protein
MKRFLTIVGSLLVAALPLAASAQTGYYEWSISGSNTDPNVNNPPNPGSGVQNLYLWLVSQCFPDTFMGLSAAEFQLYSQAPSTWQILSFNPMNSFVNAGSSPNLLLATPCTTAPVVAGQILCLSPAGGPGRVSLGFSAGGAPKAVGVDCVNFLEHAWPQFMRFRGYATQDAGAAPQDHGSDCAVTPVESSSWGQVKGLYR